MANDLDPPETLTLTPSLVPHPDDQHPPDIASVSATASPASPDVTASPVFPDVATLLSEVPAPPTTALKGPGKRKKSLTVKKLAVIQEKLDFFSQNLRLVPFAPDRALDLSRHERLFRILGLSDFSHLNLAADPLRPGLLADLIAHYTPSSRSSKVCEVCIGINRADLARALTLPVKKTFIPTEDELMVFTTKEATTVLSSFIQNWIVIMEDACVVPREVVMAMDTVNEGHAYKVDWAGLVWTMVEKELQEVTKSGQCLYASHLQLLIKHQRPELFEAEAVAVSELEELVEVAAVVEEHDDDNVAPAEEEGDLGAAPPDEQEDQNVAKTTTLEDISDMIVDANGPQLSQGLGSEVDVILGLKENVSEVDVMLGLEENCDTGVEPHWLHGGKDGANNSHYMHRCSLNDPTALGRDTFLKEEDNGGGAEDSYGRQFETKFNGLEQLNFTDLLQAVMNGNVSYSIPRHSVGESSGDFLVTGAGTHKNIISGSGLASPFSIGKRDGDEVHPFGQINPQKVMRSEGQWSGNHGTTSSFTTDFEQMQLWANKIKMDYSETEHAYANAQMQFQYAKDMLQQNDQMIHSLEKARMEEAQKRELEACRFEHELRLLTEQFQYMKDTLQQKDQMIHSLEKARMEEAQKRELEACRFEHELRLLTRVVHGYKSALLETRNVFAEYRKKFPQGEEPLYKDVEGGGGLVLSTREIKSLEQLKKEEEMCRVAEVKRLEEEEERRRVAEMIAEFAKGWNMKFTEYDQLITNLAMKFTKHKEDFLLIKESYASAKLSEAKAEEE